MDDHKTYLYGVSKGGKALFWTIWVEPYETGFQVITEYGEVGTSNPQRTKPTIFLKGKNIGKSNETTPYQQAVLTLKRKCLDKKEKQGYCDNLESVQQNITKESVLYPMLANKLSKRDLLKLKYPVYIQPKLDGVRCVAYMRNGHVVLQSRTGKPFVGLAHIEEELMAFFKQYPKVVLDGELGCFPKYSGDNTGNSSPPMFYTSLLPENYTQPPFSFQEVCGYVKRTRKTPSDPEYDAIEYHIFDVIDKDSWMMRKETLCEFENMISGMPHLMIVGSILISSSAEFLKYHGLFMACGYEGTMYRAPNGIYLEKYRSRELLKYKDMQTEEYPIVGYQEGRGNDQGTVIWVVRVGNGDGDDYKTCKVRPKGTRETRIKWLQNAEQYIGKMLTVQFQELTDDGIPRFPVGIAIRDYE